ncbi:hypothetical protein Tco_1404089 [Tanacetum coccineum]
MLLLPLRIRVGGKNEARFNLRRISLTWFLARSVRSSNADALVSRYLLVLITGTSQSRQHDKSESDSLLLSDGVFNSYTGPKLISN